MWSAAAAPHASTAPSPGAADRRAPPPTAARPRSPPLARRSLSRAAASAAGDAAGDAAAASTSAPAAAARAALEYTWYGCNSWAATFRASGVRVLVDPWLVGDLSFWGTTRLFTGVKPAYDPAAVAAGADLLLLSMALEDHCHRPTLAALPKSLPVVAGPAAAAVAREMGFASVTEVAHGREVAVAGGRLAVRGTQGALVGPPWSQRQLGFVLSETAPGGVRLYYEPHADFAAASVAEVGRVDVAVSPPCTQSLLGYGIVKGESESVPLLKLLRPAAVVALMNADFAARGPLAALIDDRGGPEELRRQLAAEPELRGVRVLVPREGEPLAVEV
jgi:L-ascorbate metabolism protein UlaG (beta-lactamase superfamily)